MPDIDHPAIGDENSIGQDATRAAHLQQDMELLRAAAIEAGEIAMRYFRKDPQVWFKDGGSPVSEADFAADRHLREVLLAARPDYGWISEETADEREPAPRQRSFIVDPIDGTRSFVAGTDQWCVSVSVVEDGLPIAGVLACPVRAELIEAVAGGKALQNGRAIEVGIDAQASALPFALPNSIFKSLPEDMQRRINVHPHISSLAYRLAMVARGELAGTFVRPNAHDWDIAAADLILKQAGGRLLTAKGQQVLYGGSQKNHGTLVAGSGTLLEEMLSVVVP